MAELTIPDFPSRSSVERKLAAYIRKGEEHRRGEHTVTVKGCKRCREARA